MEELIIVGDGDNEYEIELASNMTRIGTATNKKYATLFAASPVMFAALIAVQNHTAANAREMYEQVEAAIQLATEGK